MLSPFSSPGMVNGPSRRAVARIIQTVRNQNTIDKPTYLLSFQSLFEYGITLVSTYVQVNILIVLL